MPHNKGKKMGMVQLGLLTAGALLLSGALIVKTKRDAVADVPSAIAQQVAQQEPAGGFGSPGERAAGDSSAAPTDSESDTGNSGRGFGRPEHEAGAEPGVSTGEGQANSQADSQAGGHVGRDEAAKADVPVAEDACAAYQSWVGQPVDRAAVEATGKPHRILKPGDAMTMDFNPERINVETDEKGKKVQRVFCG